VEQVGRQEILEAIRRLTAEAGGRPPGKTLFQNLSGYRQADWYGKYWARWGDALSEAGVDANSFRAKLEENFLLEQLANVIKEIDHFPTFAELRIYSRSKEGFPSHSTWTNHFRSRNLLSVFADWVKANGRDAEFRDVISNRVQSTTVAKGVEGDGWVYLLKSGNHYKIGRSEELERRVKQISIALPQTVELVHAIRTDDPTGIEAYWHSRFSDRRANGEWFSLSNREVMAFKRRKFQ